MVKDASGNIVTTAGRTESYTSYNMPSSITAPSASFAFTYGPNHKRVKMVGPNATTIYLNPNNTGGLFYEKDIDTSGTVEHRNFITANGQVVGIIKQDVTSGTTTTTVVYLHRDKLGSTTAVTDVNGNALEQLGYEPFGKRRFISGALDPNDTIHAVNTDRGYTNHEQLDAVSLINMNGRIFDPVIGRFVSADPKVPHPGEIQSYNRYSYTRNNPLVMFDPSGFDEIADEGDVTYMSGDGGEGGGGWDCLTCDWTVTYQAPTDGSGGDGGGVGGVAGGGGDSSSCGGGGVGDGVDYTPSGGDDIRIAQQVRKVPLNRRTGMARGSNALHRFQKGNTWDGISQSYAQGASWLYYVVGGPKGTIIGGSGGNAGAIISGADASTGFYASSNLAHAGTGWFTTSTFDTENGDDVFGAGYGLGIYVGYIFDGADLRGVAHNLYVNLPGIALAFIVDTDGNPVGVTVGTGPGTGAYVTTNTRIYPTSQVCLPK